MDQNDLGQQFLDFDYYKVRRSFESDINPLEKTDAQEFFNTYSSDDPYEVQQEKFLLAVKQLAKYDSIDALSHEEVRHFVSFFKDIYSSGFRHLYAKVSQVAFSDFDVDATGSSYSATNLSNNLGIIIGQLLIDESDEAKIALTKLRKLNDHVELEQVRISYMEQQNKRAATDFSRLCDRIADEEQRLDKKTLKSKEKLRKLKRKIDSAQREYIAILGIFSAIVMAVVGGTAFTSGSFGAIATVGILDLAALAFAVGAVLCDILYITFRFVWKIVKDGETNQFPVKGEMLISINIILLAAFFICSLFSLVSCHPIIQ